MFVQPFLHFSGQCEEAVRFYQKVLGAKVETLMHFRDMPPEGGGPARPMPPGDHVMYSAMEIGDTLVMASDGCAAGQKPSGFSLAVTVKDAAEADRVFNSLAEGGAIKMPLMKTFFSPRYGQLTDKFGVDWMVLVPSGQR